MAERVSSTVFTMVRASTKLIHRTVSFLHEDMRTYIHTHNTHDRSITHSENVSLDDILNLTTAVLVIVINYTKRTLLVLCNTRITPLAVCDV